MEAPRRPEPADPDFDASPGLRRWPLDFDPTGHQRLVVNPFLAVLGLVGLGWISFDILYDSPVPVLAIATMLPIALLRYLIQYHCLDCGRTGSYSRHKTHACPGVLARWREHQRWRFPFPTPGTQLVIWGWVLGAVGLLVVITALTRP